MCLNIGHSLRPVLNREAGPGEAQSNEVWIRGAIGRRGRPTLPAINSIPPLAWSKASPRPSPNRNLAKWAQVIAGPRRAGFAERCALAFQFERAHTACA